MSRIDELQRLHEGAGPAGEMRTISTRDLQVSLHNSWPAIHRVLVAARATATCGDMIRASMNEGQGSLMRELVEALRALDHGETNT